MTSVKNAVISLAFKATVSSECTFLNRSLYATDDRGDSYPRKDWGTEGIIAVGIIAEIYLQYVNSKLSNNWPGYYDAVHIFNVYRMDCSDVTRDCWIVRNF